MTYAEACAVLELQGSPDAATVQRAYRKAARRAHPDAGGSNAAMQRVNEARKVALAGPPFDVDHWRREYARAQAQQPWPEQRGYYSPWSDPAYTWEQHRRDQEAVIRAAMAAQQAATDAVFASWGMGGRPQDSAEFMRNAAPPPPDPPRPALQPKRPWWKRLLQRGA